VWEIERGSKEGEDVVVIFHGETAEDVRFKSACHLRCYTS